MADQGPRTRSANKQEPSWPAANPAPPPATGQDQEVPDQPLAPAGSDAGTSQTSDVVGEPGDREAERAGDLPGWWADRTGRHSRSEPAGSASQPSVPSEPEAPSGPPVPQEPTGPPLPEEPSTPTPGQPVPDPQPLTAPPGDPEPQPPHPASAHQGWIDVSAAEPDAERVAQVEPVPEPVPAPQPVEPGDPQPAPPPTQPHPETPATPYPSPDPSAPEPGPDQPAPTSPPAPLAPSDPGVPPSARERPFPTGGNAESAGSWSADGEGTERAPAGQRGSLTINDRVVQRIATLAADHIPGISTSSSGLARLTGLGDNAIKATVAGTQVRAHVHVVVPWPESVNDMTSQVRSTVSDEIARLTGLNVDGVDVHAEMGDPIAEPESRRVH